MFIKKVKLETRKPHSNSGKLNSQSMQKTTTPNSGLVFSFSYDTTSSEHFLSNYRFYTKLLSMTAYTEKKKASHDVRTN